MLEDITRRQLVSDVPLCTLLSGGLDSSMITAMAAKTLGSNEVRSFSVDFAGAGDIFQASRQLALVAAARRLGLPATRLEMCAVAAQYLSVAEFDLPTVLYAKFSAPPVADQLDIDAFQQGRRVSTFRLSVRPQPTRGPAPEPAQEDRGAVRSPQERTHVH